MKGEGKKGAPRNRPLFDQGRLARVEIRALLEKHPPLAKPLTWKHIRPYLTNELGKRAIEGHVKAIRDEYTALSAIQTAPGFRQSDTYGIPERVNTSSSGTLPESRVFDRRD